MKDVTVDKRKFQLVCITDTVANSEIYSDKQPEGYVPFVLSVARRRLRLVGRIGLDLHGRLTRGGMEAITEYADTHKAFNCMYASTWICMGISGIFVNRFSSLYFYREGNVPNLS